MTAHDDMMPVRSRSKTLRAGRTLALRVLYAADMADLTPTQVWQRSAQDLLFAGEEFPQPQNSFGVTQKGELTEGEEEPEDAPEAVPESWQAVLAASKALVGDKRREQKDPGTAAAQIAQHWVKRIELGTPDLDAALQASSPRWKIGRMAPIDRNILRIGAFELLKCAVPPRDVIFDCVELAKNYGDKDSARFVNGLLDQFCRDQGIKI